MFIGHIGVGLVLKKIEPKLNLGLLLFASLFLDILLGFLVLVGLEQIVVPANYEHLHYLNFIFPYSHSFLAGVGWSLIAFAVTYVLWNQEEIHSRIKASFAIGGAVSLHWICDWIEHPPQLPFADVSSKQLGLGLWNTLELALALEVLLMVVGITLYLRIAQNIGRKGRWGILVLMGLLTPIAVMGQATVAQAPEPLSVAVSLVVQIVVVSGLAAWIDRNREGTA